MKNQNIYIIIILFFSPFLLINADEPHIGSTNDCDTCWRYILDFWDIPKEGLFLDEGENRRIEKFLESQFVNKSRETLIRYIIHRQEIGSISPSFSMNETIITCEFIFPSNQSYIIYRFNFFIKSESIEKISYFCAVDDNLQVGELLWKIE